MEVGKKAGMQNKVGLHVRFQAGTSETGRFGEVVKDCNLATHIWTKVLCAQTEQGGASYSLVGSYELGQGSQPL